MMLRAQEKVKIKNLVFIFLTWALLLVPCDLFAQPVPSADLISKASQYDGKVVVYEGEVIGDVMVRGEYAWINVNDGSNAIGIWAPKALLRDVVFTGSYKSKGDGVEITGVFRRVCPEHGGDMDIHAISLRKTGAGRIVVERLNLDKKNLIVVLFGALCLVWILSLFIRK